MFHTLPFGSIVVSNSGVLFCEGMWHVFSLYLKMTRAKKFALKPKLRGNKYVCVNKDTGVSEKGQPLSGQSGESSCVKYNLCASNKMIHGTSVNTEIKVSCNNFRKSEGNFAHGGNTVVCINLLCTFIQKKQELQALWW
jgi:hypothetical protein